MDKPIITALASYGMSGRIFHAPFLLADKRFKLVKVLERTKNESEGKIPGAQIVRDFSDLSNDPEIELIVVNTPNSLHFAMAKQALENGKHVIVEKPFTSNVVEADELIKLADKNKRILAVYHNRRFDTEFQTVRQIIEDGILGEIKLFESKIYRWKPEIGNKRWKVEPNPGSGLLYDLGAHLIDQALVLFGHPKSIFADLAAFRENAKVDDYFNLIFDYGSKKVLLKSFLMSAANESRFAIYGEKGSFIKYGADIQEILLDSGIMPGQNGWESNFENQQGKIYTSKGIIIPQAVHSDYRDFFSNVALAIRDGRELLVKPRQAREVISMIELALQSFKEKRIVGLKD